MLAMPNVRRMKTLLLVLSNEGCPRNVGGGKPDLVVCKIHIFHYYSNEGCPRNVGGGNTDPVVCTWT